MSRIKNAKNGIGLGIVNYALGILGPFIVRTIIIRTLGNEYLGLNTLFSSILQVLSLSELGVGVAITYLLYEPIAQRNIARVNAILGFYKMVYRIIGIVILVVSVILAFFLPYLISGGYPDNINIYMLYFIYVANTVVSYFLFAYKRVILDTNQRYDLVMSVAMIASVIRYGFQIFILTAVRNYYGYAIMLPVATIIDNIICSIVVDRKFPMYKAKGMLSREECMVVLKNTSGAFCTKIGNAVYLSADSIVISAFLGLNILGVYNNYYYVISTFIALFAVIHNTIRPIIGSIWVSDTKERNWSMFKTIYNIYLWFTIVICACTLPLIQQFEFLWGGEDNTLPFTIGLLLVIYFFFSRLTSLQGVYLEATGVLWRGKFIPLISAGVNLALNVLLVNVIGLNGVLLSSVIGIALVTIPGYSVLMQKEIFSEIQCTKFLLIQYSKSIIKVLVTCVVCFFISSKIPIEGWMGFVIKGVLLLLISNLCLALLSWKEKDFSEMLAFIRRLLQNR